MRRALRATALGIVFCFVTGTASARIPDEGPTRERMEAVRPSALDTAKELLIHLGKKIRKTRLDCSHFTHYLFERVGLEYSYANSSSLYDGVNEFYRVRQPEAGDLIVWRGHVGIVVDPEERTFLSKLRSGVKIASYDSRYWKRRGTPRFLRYAGATPDSLDETVLTARGSE